MHQWDQFSVRSVIPVQSAGGQQHVGARASSTEFLLVLLCIRIDRTCHRSITTGKSFQWPWMCCKLWRASLDEAWFQPIFPLWLLQWWYLKMWRYYFTLTSPCSHSEQDLQGCEDFSNAEFLLRCAPAESPVSQHRQSHFCQPISPLVQVLLLDLLCCQCLLMPLFILSLPHYQL